jgi:hypothetical protein
MTRYIIIALFVVLCDHAADKIVDWQFSHEDHGYSKQERTAMDSLVRKATKSKLDQRAEVMGVFSLSEADLDRKPDLFGGRP